MSTLRLLPILAALALQGATKSYDLVWRPKPGSVAKYRLHLALQLESTHVDVSADLRMTVRKRASEGGYEVETATTNVRVTTDQSTQTLPDEPPTVERYDPTGKRISTATEDSENPFSQVMGPATDFMAPPTAVQPGDKWSRDLPGDAKAGRHSARVDYRLVGAEKGSPNVLRVKYAYAETEGAARAKGEGFFLVDARDASVVSFETNLKNVQISPDVPPGTVILTMRRASS